MNLSKNYFNFDTKKSTAHALETKYEGLEKEKSIFK